MNDNSKSDRCTGADCQSMEPLVSALIDGELLLDDQISIENHLESCLDCQKLKRDFEFINKTIANPISTKDHSHPNSLNPEVSADQHVEPAINPSMTPAINRTFTRWVTLAIAASLLVVVWLPTADSKAKLSVENIAQPLTDFHVLKQQELRSQKLMLKTMQLELRSLRLELGQLDPDLATRELYAKKIDEMMNRVSHIDDSSDL